VKSFLALRRQIKVKELDSIRRNSLMLPTRSIPLNQKLVAQRFAESGAARLGLNAVQFGEIVSGIIAKYATNEREAESLLRSLRVEELALARACAAGNDAAWDQFIMRYRVSLYDAARAITRDEGSARELADGVYAELFGLGERDGVRRSKLEHYSGRGSLEGWLRTVLAQEWVNRYRRTRRETSLEEHEEAGVQFAADPPQPAPSDMSSLAKATDAALADLANEDRYILASYHLDGRKLADIAKTLGVHESTISRRLDRITMQVRSGILKHLQQQGLTRRQAEEALEVDVRDVSIDLRSRLGTNSSASGLQDGPTRAFIQGKDSQ
jgi:RNA polymerase sigma-70 factor (ECF subfamily)